jgi:hypothetical protein
MLAMQQGEEVNRMRRAKPERHIVDELALSQVYPFAISNKCQKTRG